MEGYRLIIWNLVDDEPATSEFLDSLGFQVSGEMVISEIKKANEDPELSSIEELENIASANNFDIREQGSEGKVEVRIYTTSGERHMISLEATLRGEELFRTEVLEPEARLEGLLEALGLRKVNA